MGAATAGSHGRQLLLRHRKSELFEKPKIGFLFGVEKNRTVSNQPQKYQQVKTLEIPKQGVVTHLKEFGFVKLFRKAFRNEDSRHYILYLPDTEMLKQTTRQKFLDLHDIHWGIENFHFRH